MENRIAKNVIRSGFELTNLILKLVDTNFPGLGIYNIFVDTYIRGSHYRVSGLVLEI